MAPATLTEKQQQVYNLLTDDKDPKEIAEALGVSKAAIYSHIRAIKEAGHTIPAKYANVGTGAGRGRTGKRGTGRNTGKGATTGTRGRGRTGKAPTAVVPPTPTPAPTPVASLTAEQVADAEAIVADLTGGLDKHRHEIADRLEAIASEVSALETQIGGLNEEAQTLRNTDATLEAMQKTLTSGPPASADANGAGKVTLSGATA